MTCTRELVRNPRRVIIAGVRWEFPSVEYAGCRPLRICIPYAQANRPRHPTLVEVWEKARRENGKRGWSAAGAYAVTMAWRRDSDARWDVENFSSGPLNALAQGLFGENPGPPMEWGPGARDDLFHALFLHRVEVTDEQRDRGGYGLAIVVTRRGTA